MVRVLLLEHRLTSLQIGISRILKSQRCSSLETGSNLFGVLVVIARYLRDCVRIASGRANRTTTDLLVKHPIPFVDKCDKLAICVIRAFPRELVPFINTSECLV